MLILCKQLDIVFGLMDLDSEHFFDEDKKCSSIKVPKDIG
jgi:hypothetical protein